MSSSTPGAKNDLAALADVIRRILPPRPPISNLEVKEDLGHVSFHWQAKDFAVDRRLHVFEITGNRLFVTASSILLQAVLQRKDKHRRVIEAVIDVLSEVQHQVDVNRRIETSVTLLRSAEKTLQKLILHKETKAKTSAALEPVSANESNAVPTASSKQTK